jgi:hypothetical protein
VSHIESVTVAFASTSNENPPQTFTDVQRVIESQHTLKINRRSDDPNREIWICIPYTAMDYWSQTIRI